jgi:hypothetical protein
MDAHRWLAGRTRGRAVAAGLCLGLLAGSLLLVGPRAPVQAGTETGTCTLTVRTVDGQSADSVMANPYEHILVEGSGWLPNSLAMLDVGGFMQWDWEYAPDVTVLPIDADGSPQNMELQSERHYGTFVWRASQAAPACVQEVSVTVLPLADVRCCTHKLAIQWLYLNGITTGCAPDLFCPYGLVTRGQMATFLARALDLPPTDTDYFTDDETNKHEANINRLREADITFGCAPELYCPDGLVTRAQMASFLVRAFDLPSTDTDYFTDDETSTHEANINRLRAAGITFGCVDEGPTDFCPDGLVTRRQMASFLYRAMN